MQTRLKLCRKGIEWVGVDCLYLAGDMDGLQAVVSTVMEFPESIKCEQLRA